MIYLVIALAFVIAYMYDESNNLKEQIAELEAFQHNHAGQFVDTPNPVDIIEAANAGGAVDIDEKSFNEARNYMSQDVSLKDVMTKTPVWDKSDGVGGHAGCIVVDDPWVPGTKLTDEKRQELSEALESLIDRKWDDDAPLVIIQSRVHDEDLPGYIDSTLDYSWITPQIRGTHPYSFRSGEWADILGITGVDCIVGVGNFDTTVALSCDWAR